MAWALLLLWLHAAAECDLSCQWGQDASRCVESECQCVGEACESCEAHVIQQCCLDHAQSASKPRLCKSADLAVTVQHCVESGCSDCSQEQRLERVAECCEGDFHDVELPKLCLESGPCSGLQGPAAIRCSWDQEVTSCVQGICDCEACECQEDSGTISSCCDEHRQAVEPPRQCIEAILTEDVKNCIAQTCSESELKACKDDPKVLRQCCIDHRHGFEPPKMCQSEDSAAASILP